MLGVHACARTCIICVCVFLCALVRVHSVSLSGGLGGLGGGCSSSCVARCPAVPSFLAMHVRLVFSGGCLYFDFRYTVQQFGRSADFGNVEFENEWVAVPHVCLVGVFSTCFLSFFPGAHAVDRLKHTAPTPVRALPSMQCGCHCSAATLQPLSRSPHQWRQP